MCFTNAQLHKIADSAYDYAEYLRDATKEGIWFEPITNPDPTRKTFAYYIDKIGRARGDRIGTIEFDQNGKQVALYINPDILTYYGL